jgi:hypothetical protein
MQVRDQEMAALRRFGILSAMQVSFGYVLGLFWVCIGSVLALCMYVSLPHPQWSFFLFPPGPCIFFLLFEHPREKSGKRPKSYKPSTAP